MSTTTTPIAVDADSVSFFHKVADKMESLFKKQLSWEKSALADINLAAPLVETAVAFLDPAVAPEVDDSIAAIQKGLSRAAVLIEDAGSTPTIQSVLGSVQTNISAVEGAVQIKSPATAAKVTAVTETITSLLESILAVLPVA